MRFAITANDRYLGVFETFIHAGWKPLKLFTVPAKSRLGNQQAVINLASEQGAAIQLSRMTESDMRELRDQGCDALIVASYDWVIGDWAPFIKYAVNFHSSPLPEGRGSYPLVQAILEKRNSWAITCHRLSPKIDGGDILALEHFSMQQDECHESLDLKVQMAAKRLAAKVANRFTEFWDQAVPQTEGSYWKKFTLAERVIDFEKPVEDILRHIRAFGSMESLAKVGDAWLVVRRAVGWTETHMHPPGQAVHVFNNSIVVAASDGYIGLLESDMAPHAVAIELEGASALTEQIAADNQTAFSS